MANHQVGPHSSFDRDVLPTGNNIAATQRIRPRKPEKCQHRSSRIATKLLEDIPTARGAIGPAATTTTTTKIIVKQKSCKDLWSLTNEDKTIVEDLEMETDSLKDAIMNIVNRAGKIMNVPDIEVL